VDQLYPRKLVFISLAATALHVVFACLKQPFDFADLIPVIHTLEPVEGAAVPRKSVVALQLSLQETAPHNTDWTDCKAV
jgi:hypothetical protein